MAGAAALLATRGDLIQRHVLGIHNRIVGIGAVFLERWAFLAGGWPVRLAWPGWRIGQRVAGTRDLQAEAGGEQTGGRRDGEKLST